MSDSVQQLHSIRLQPQKMSTNTVQQNKQELLDSIQQSANQLTQLSKFHATNGNGVHMSPNPIIRGSNAGGAFTTKNAANKNYFKGQHSLISQKQSNKTNLSLHFEEQSPDQTEEGTHAFHKVKEELDATIKDLDQKLNKVLAKQEYEYLQSYSIYVKRKENELKELILKIKEKNQNGTLKDEKMLQMKQALIKVQEDQFKQDKQVQEMQDKVKYYKTKCDNLEQENTFLQKQTLDTKRKNKLLKVAISRLQAEVEEKESKKENEIETKKEQEKSHFFITDLLQAATNQESTNQISPRLANASTTHQLETSLFLIGGESTTVHNQSSLLDISQLSQKKHRRYQSTSVNKFTSVNFQTENLKFSTFLDVIFRSKLDKLDMKEQIQKYVTALETNYNNFIADMKIKHEKLQTKIRKLKSAKVNQVVERTEIEELFVICIDEVRREVMRRRLKNDLQVKGTLKINTLQTKQQMSKEEYDDFEQSLLKLAELTKNKIKISDFTQSDRFNLMELFVNNEKTLVKMYESLFPHRLPSFSINPAAGTSHEKSLMLSKSMVIEENEKTGQRYNSTGRYKNSGMKGQQSSKKQDSKNKLEMSINEDLMLSRDSQGVMTDLPMSGESALRLTNGDRLEPRMSNRNEFTLPSIKEAKQILKDAKRSESVRASQQ